jgi:hypothetical protein
MQTPSGRSQRLSVHGIAFQERLRIGICLAVLAGVAALCPLCESQAPESPSARDTLHTINPPSINRTPDANDKMAMNEQHAKKVNFENANAERRKQLVADSALLLKLAAELKGEIDKTPKDTLSLAAIRKAEEIERVAKVVQQKMKLTMAAN